MTDRHQAKPYPLRMPDGLRAQLEEDAKKIGRSLNAEIVARLEDSFAIMKPAETPILQALQDIAKTELVIEGFDREIARHSKNGTIPKWDSPVLLELHSHREAFKGSLALCRANLDKLILSESAVPTKATVKRVPRSK